MKDDETSYSLGFGPPCPACRFTQPRLDYVAVSYFEGKQIFCSNPDCKKPLDYWRATLSVLRDPGTSEFMLLSLGAQLSGFVFPLRANEIKELNLSDYGIPADATILRLIFTPQGGSAFPLIMHYNRVPSNPLQTKFSVYGLELPDSNPNLQTAASVTWVHKNDATVSWSHLLEAFEALAAKRWRSVILPAYMAFELSLTPLVSEGLRQHFSKTIVEDFENENYPSSLALNIILPLLSDCARGVRLLPEIQGQINRLRKLRNDIVHHGVQHTEVSEKTAAELLCASVFGLEYLRYVRKHVFREVCN